MTGALAEATGHPAAYVSPAAHATADERLQTGTTTNGSSEPMAATASRPTDAAQP